MKKNVLTVFNMLVVVEDILQTNASLIPTIAGMEAEAQWFFQAMDAIRQFDIGLSQAPDHPARLKMKYEEALDPILLFNSRKMSAYAAIQENTVLLQQVSVTPTALNRMDNNRKASFGRLLHETIQTHLPDLDKYGLSANTQAALEKATRDFEESIPTVRGIIVQRATSRSRQNDLVRQTNSRIKDVMDKIVLAVETEHPKFVALYKRCRRQVDLTRSKLALNGSVVQADGTPIFGARITIGTQTLKSTSKGNFRLLHFPPGVYQLRIEKPGFLPTEEQIIIHNPGETTRVRVVLSPVDLQG